MINSDKEKTSIQGTLLMLDDRTPHIAIVVQAVKPAHGSHDEPTVVATTLSDEDGYYQFTSLPPAQYQVRCYTLSGYVYHQEGKVLQVRPGRPLKGVDFRIAPFKKGIWKNYSSLDGLSDYALAIHRDPDGVMWFGGFDGVSRYDGKGFVKLTKRDGLLPGPVRTIHRDPDGVMWFGTGFDGKQNSGVSRYDGEEFVNFTADDDLSPGIVRGIYRDPDGILWIAARGGVSCYDGKEFVNFTRKDGLPQDTVLAIYRDPDGIMWFATGQGLGVPPRGAGVSRYDGKEFVNFTTEDGLAGNAVHAIQGAPGGVIWFATDGGVSRYDGKEFANFTTEDGLANNHVRSIYRDSDGMMWFGTWGGGVSRYDGKGFVNFTTEDGLRSNEVVAIHRDPDGVMWFGTLNRGLSRYDGEGLVNFTTKDGLIGKEACAIYRDSDGVMWFGTGHWESVSERAEGAGVSRYDGRNVVSFTPEDGLVDSSVLAIHRDLDGVMWFGTRRGVSRYDGKEFVTFTVEDGLAHNEVYAINRDLDGVMWFGTGYWTGSGGVCQYDGKEFVNLTKEHGLPRSVHAIQSAGNDAIWFGTWGDGVFRYDGQESIHLTTEDGLAHDFVECIYRDPDGMMWFGTFGGVSRYDGESFVNYTIEDGLTNDRVYAIHSDTDGILWFGTDGGGVCGYDGHTWVSLDTRDGLAGNRVETIQPGADGTLWFGTNGGVTRYRPSATPPKVRIVSVTTDQTYEDLSAVPAFTPGIRLIIQYSAVDLKTLPEKRQYRCRIQAFGKSLREEEIDSDWRKPTKADSFDYVFDRPGTYTFEVQAIDRDLNYSEPASVKLEVIPDPRNHRIIELEEHIREQELAELERVHQELEDARQIQQSLLPTKSPTVAGFEIAGTSLPAREVSGDFYDYLPLEKNIGIALVDVTGKSMKAAMVAALANGMLNEQIKGHRELWDYPSKLLGELNSALRPRMIRGMFAAMSLCVLQTDKKRLIFSNAGMPYPIVKRSDEVWELKLNGMPLGLIDIVEHEDLGVDLESGDFVVFCSDGVIEAENGAGEMYQSERLLEVVQQADSGLSARGMVDLILNDVIAYVGDEEASDDITIVVIRCAE